MNECHGLEIMRYTLVCTGSEKFTLMCLAAGNAHQLLERGARSARSGGAREPGDSSEVLPGSQVVGCLLDRSRWIALGPSQVLQRGLAFYGNYCTLQCGTLRLR